VSAREREGADRAAPNRRHGHLAQGRRGVSRGREGDRAHHTGGEGGVGDRRFRAMGEVEERDEPRGGGGRGHARGVEEREGGSFGGGLLAAAATAHAARGARGGVGRGWAGGARQSRLGRGREGGSAGPHAGWSKAAWATREGKEEGGGKKRKKGVVAGPKGERERFPFYFLLIFPIIYFISSLLLNAYFMETKQIHTKGNRCVARPDATTKENISRVHHTQDVELILARTLKKNKA
jgi:hypothetical protein